MAKNWWESFAEYVGLISPIDPENFKSNHEYAHTKTFNYRNASLLSLEEKDYLEVTYRAVRDEVDPKLWRVQLVILNPATGSFYISSEKPTLSERPFVGDLLHEETCSEAMSYKHMLNHMKFLEEDLRRKAGFSELDTARKLHLNQSNTIDLSVNHYHAVALQDGFLVNNGKYDHKSNHDGLSEQGGVYQLEDFSKTGQVTKRLAYTGFSPEKIGHFNNCEENIANLYEELDDGFVNFNGYIVREDWFQNLQKKYKAVQEIRATKYGFFKGGLKKRHIADAIIALKDFTIIAAKGALEGSPRNVLKHYEAMKEKYGDYEFLDKAQFVGQDDLAIYKDRAELKVQEDDKNLAKLDEIELGFAAFKEGVGEKNAERQKLIDSVYVHDNYMVFKTDLEEIKAQKQAIETLEEEIADGKYKTTALKNARDRLSEQKDTLATFVESAANKALQDEQVFPIVAEHYMHLKKNERTSFSDGFDERVDYFVDYFQKEHERYARKVESFWLPVEYEEKLEALDVIVQRLPAFAPEYLNEDDKNRHHHLKADIQDFREEIMAEGENRIPEAIVDQLDQKSRDAEKEQQRAIQKQKAEREDRERANLEHKIQTHENRHFEQLSSQAGFTGSAQGGAGGSGGNSEASSNSVSNTNVNKNSNSICAPSTSSTMGLMGSSFEKALFNKTKYYNECIEKEIYEERKSIKKIFNNHIKIENKTSFQKYRTPKPN